jgi:ABC-type multidrug transport system fused ATPase/permease subunit
MLKQQQNHKQDLDLEVKENETLALVGPSGSGKSSIAALLTRMYEPDQGQILIGQRHTPLEAIPKYHVRKSISYVTQVSCIHVWGGARIWCLPYLSAFISFQ